MEKYHPLRVVHGPSLDDLCRALARFKRKRPPTVFFYVDQEPNRIDIFVIGINFVGKDLNRLLITGRIKHSHLVECWKFPDSKVRMVYDFEDKSGRFIDDSQYLAK